MTVLKFLNDFYSSLEKKGIFIEKSESLPCTSIDARFSRTDKSLQDFDFLNHSFIVKNTSLVQNDAWRVRIRKEKGILVLNVFNEDPDIFLIKNAKAKSFEELLSFAKVDIKKLLLT